MSVARRLFVAVIAMTLLAGCSRGEEAARPETVEAAAAVLAEDLSRGELTRMPVNSGDPETDLPILLAGMQGLRPTVTPGNIRQAGDAATIDLDYSWPLSSPWTYESTAVVVRKGTVWKLEWAPEVLHPRLTAENRLERDRQSTERGNVLGENDVVLVEDTPVQMLGLNKAAVQPDEQEASARQIADVVGINADAYLAKVHASGALAFVEARAVRREEVPSSFKNIKGAEQLTVNLPAPKSTGYAESLLGTVGYATQEDVDRAGGALFVGDVIGKSGLQQTFDIDLRGSGGNRVFLASRDSAPGTGQANSDNLLADFPDIPGHALHTTIDDSIQTAAENALDDVKGPASVAVIRVGTGAVVAAADSPSARRSLDSTLGEMGPGLSMAPITALAMLRSGISLDDRVDCEESVSVDGQRFDNGEDYSRDGRSMTLADALVSECNTAVAAVQGRVALDAPRSAASVLGLNAPRDLGAPTHFGEVKVAENNVQRTEALIGRGGGMVSVSPLGMAAMAASVEAGVTVFPYVVAERRQVPEDVPTLTEDEAKALRDMMMGAPGSYGQLTHHATGTADERTWVVGYNKEYAVAIVLSEQAADSTSLATVARAVTN